jgi:hypothetical protein
VEEEEEDEDEEEEDEDEEGEGEEDFLTDSCEKNFIDSFSE